MDVGSAAHRWAETLREAWPARDAARFTALYRDAAEFRSPFGEPEAAVTHMRRSLLLGEGDVEVWVGEPLVGGDRAAVEWWAVVIIEGATHSFGGTAWVRFDDEGAVVEENDYWHSSPTRAEPWSDWGRNNAG